MHMSIFGQSMVLQNAYRSNLKIIEVFHQFYFQKFVTNKLILKFSSQFSPTIPITALLYQSVDLSPLYVSLFMLNTRVNPYLKQHGSIPHLLNRISPSILIEMTKVIRYNFIWKCILTYANGCMCSLCER